MSAKIRLWAWGGAILVTLIGGEVLSRRSQFGRPGVGVASVAEADLLRAAEKRVMPAVPASRGSTAGVAVSEVVLDMQGRVTNVRVLESPDHGVSEEVERALWQWRFDTAKLVGPTNATEITGKVTFYFSFTGPGTVLTSEAAQSQSIRPFR